MPLEKNTVSVPGGTYPLAGRTTARMGFGAMQLERHRAHPDKAAAVLRRALDLGINHIDTAQFYGQGFVNKTIRKVVGPASDVVVSSKVGAMSNPQGRPSLKPAQRPEQLRASVEANLLSLQLERIPLINLRRLDVGPGISAEGDQIVDIDDQLEVLTAMRGEGKIDAIGLSAVTMDGLRRALPARISCVQNAYSMVSREYEDMLALCLEQSIAWVPFFPLGGAFPSWPKVKDQPAVLDVSVRLEATPSQLGLAWLLLHAPNILLIPGTANIKHLEQNVAAASLELDAATMVVLDTVGSQ